MEATFRFLQCFCSATVTHSPPPAPPPPPVHLLCSHPNYQQVFQGDQSLCNATFPQAAAVTPQIRTGTKQSMAARQRRRKITAKTQELGKLIPGAHKMNTAQMLQAASKYVKFLQAQLALLQKTQIPLSTYGFQYHQHNPMELSLLLASSAVQEKLYSEEKCLAPKQLLDHLS